MNKPFSYRTKNITFTRAIHITILTCCLLAVGCSVDDVMVSRVPGTPAPAPELSAENYPLVDGSTSTAPLNMLVACKMLGTPCQWITWLEGYMHMAPDLTDFDGEFPSISVSGTHGSYMNLIARHVDLILVAREPSQDELVAARSASVQLIAEPVALDAFVFIVNEDNPVENLSTDQIRDIYTGKLTNWRAVSGPESEIHPYQRNPNSGSQELMEKLVMKGAPMVEAPELVLLKMMAPFYAVSDDPLGVGYSVFYFEEYMAGVEQVKLSAVDGVKPSPESIQSGEYPYVTEVYAVIRADLPPESTAYKLWAWLFSPQGQEVVAESGYVPVAE